MVWQGLYESHSFQVWIVGGISTIVELTTDTTVLLGAMHSTLLERSKGSPRCITRGYQLKSFIMPNETEKDLRAREVVSERAAKHVAAFFPHMTCRWSRTSIGCGLSMKHGSAKVNRLTC